MTKHIKIEDYSTDDKFKMKITIKSVDAAMALQSLIGCTKSDEIPHAAGLDPYSLVGKELDEAFNRVQNILTNKVGMGNELEINVVKHNDE
jgi:ribosomal protein S13